MFSPHLDYAKWHARQRRRQLLHRWGWRFAWATLMATGGALGAMLALPWHP